MSGNTEKPKDEMQRLFRKIAGKPLAGEKDDQLRSRAARRMNAGLDEFEQIGLRLAKSYWYGEIEKVPSHHMDRARELAFVHPLQEATDAIESAERFLEELRRRLAVRAAGALHRPAGDPALDRRRRVSDFDENGNSGSAGLEPAVSLNALRQLTSR